MRKGIDLAAWTKPFQHLLFYTQLILSSIAFGKVLWSGVSYYKRAAGPSAGHGLYPWTHPFFHPVESDTLNYVIVCLALALIWAPAYFLAGRGTRSFIQTKCETVHPFLLSVSVGLSLLFFLYSFLLPFDAIPYPLAAVAAIPAVALILFVLYDHYPRNTVLPRRALTFLFVAGLFLVASKEPFAIATGPVKLMNEYADVYGETAVRGKFVSNEDFLNHLQPSDACSVRAFLHLALSLTGPDNRTAPNGDTEWFKRYQQADLSPTQKYVEALISGDKVSSVIAANFPPAGRGELGADPEMESCIKNLRNVDAEGIKQFYLGNLLEYCYQNMGRGQINHFSHVLNPINEYRLGKPLRSIYMQYGLGNTFLMKWVMDLFGGISIQAYHKAYAFYILYYLIFLLMLMFLFRDAIFISGAYAIIPVCLFVQGYIPLILAPGIIPSIHLLDTSVIICLIIFYRRRDFLCLCIAVGLSLVSILNNLEFGAAVFAALTASLALYVLENKKGKSALLWGAAGVCIAIAAISLWRFSVQTVFAQIFPYFLHGLFSWPVQPRQIIIFTIVYLIASYAFLILLKGHRTYLKYIYAFVFAYAQTLLIYFYWSGLLNHLPPIMPFIWLQLFLMLYIAKKELLHQFSFLKAIDVSVVVLSVLLLLFGVREASQFYSDKSEFADIFKVHKSYAWRFPRARVKTTVNPEIMQEAIDLIHRYSNSADTRVYILSKYDNLLPFLSDRYSAMPFFETVAHLFSEREYKMVVDKIRNDKPKYLFADSRLGSFASDPWEKIYPSASFAKERACRLARYDLLKQIFDEVKSDYEKVEQGRLLSVYRRKGA
jgi:hypothetical protein